MERDIAETQPGQLITGSTQSLTAASTLPSSTSYTLHSEEVTMSSPMQSLGDSPMSLPTPGTERECSGFAAVAAAAAAAAANAGNLNNNCTSTQQQGMSNGTYCQRRNKSALGKHRHQPYDRSPGGGSTCSTSSDESGNEDGDTDPQGKPDQHVRKRTAANERERKRMHTVNSAFDQLRELVPTYPSSRKLSKIDTLKLACTYIQDLKTLLINSHIMPHGEDVVYHPDGYATTSPSPVYPGVHVKAEARYAVSQDYPASACTYPPFRVQQSYISVSHSKHVEAWLRSLCVLATLQTL